MTLTLIQIKLMIILNLNNFTELLPSSKKESDKRPPCFLIIWIASKFPDPFNLSTASTAKFAKNSLCWAKILELIVVLAICYKKKFFIIREINEGQRS